MLEGQEQQTTPPAWSTHGQGTCIPRGSQRQHVPYAPEATRPLVVWNSAVLFDYTALDTL
jgi:hypothetical protein